MDLVKISNEVKCLAESLGWTVYETRIAETGSIYVEIRRRREWLVVRVADHKRVHTRWMTTLSLAPGDLWWDQLEGLLASCYGTVGDVL